MVVYNSERVPSFEVEKQVGRWRVELLRSGLGGRQGGVDVVFGKNG